MKTSKLPQSALLLLGLFFYSCQPSSNSNQNAVGSSIIQSDSLNNDDDDEILPFEREDEIIGLDEKWTGDLDGIVERRRIRALVPYSLTSYFIDGAERRGTAYEALSFFEKKLNEKLGKGGVPHVRVIFVPLSRDKILPALLEGHGDLAVANLTITPQRLEQIEFSTPILKKCKRIGGNRTCRCKGKLL